MLQLEERRQSMWRLNLNSRIVIISNKYFTGNGHGYQQNIHRSGDLSLCSVHHWLGEGLSFWGMFVKIQIRDHRQQGDGHLDCNSCSLGFGNPNITILIWFQEMYFVRLQHYSSPWQCVWLLGFEFFNVDKTVTILMYFSPINIKIPHISFSPDMNFQWHGALKNDRKYRHTETKMS